MKNLPKITQFVLLLLFVSFVFQPGPVEGKPVADYTVNSIPIQPIGDSGVHWKVYAGETISFNGGPSENEESYTWDFGEGDEPIYKETSTISHQYNTSRAQPYMFKLTVDDKDGNTDTAYGNLTVVERPLAVLKITDENGNDLAPDYTITVGQTIIFDGSGSEGDLRQYEFAYALEGAFIPDVQQDSPTYSYSYNKADDYQVGLAVVDWLGNKSKPDKDDFLTITVEKESTSTSTDFELPVDPLYLGVGVAVFIFIIVIGVLYRNGYIGGPIMTGSGSSKKDSKPSTPPPPPPPPPPGSGMGSLMGGQQGSTGPGITDINSLMGGLNDDPAGGFGKPAGNETVYEVKNCPKCKGKIPITSLDRPLKVSCQDCGASFTLKGKPGDANRSAPAPQAPAPVAEKKDFVYDMKTCPKCKSKIPITSEDRPLKVTCPGCSASFTLKDKSKKSAQNTAGSKAPPADDTEIVMCPTCGKAQPVSASASATTCVSCGSRFGL